MHNIDENEVLRDALSGLNEEVPPMPEGLHAAWMQKVEDDMNETRTEKTRTMKTVTRWLSVAAAMVFVIGGTLLTGGVGNVIGTLFGVLTLTTIKSIVVTSGLRDPWWQTITTGAMLCFFILLQSVVLSNRGKFKLSDLFRKKKTDVILEKN